MPAAEQDEGGAPGRPSVLFEQSRRLLRFFTIVMALTLFGLGAFFMFTAGFFAGYVISLWLAILSPLNIAAEFKQVQRLRGVAALPGRGRGLRARL